MCINKLTKLSNSVVKIIITNVTILLFSATLVGKANWTFLVYVQANNSLNSFAHKNFVDMAAVGSNKNLNILVEWHQPNKPGVWRYKIEQGKMVLDSCQPANITDGNSVSDLISSMDWAAKKYPAEKYSLILWNHGIGILDPSWGDSMNIISPKGVWQNKRTQIAGITTKVTHGKYAQHVHRAILFNEHARTYMNNQELAQALRIIKTEVLNGKKIDLLGMDACLMAMLEVAYQVHDYANYFIGSQEVELAYGWNYASVLNAFASGNTTAEAAARNMVQSFGEFYQDKIRFYTQSAIDLSKINLLKDTLNFLAQQIFSSKVLNRDKLVTRALKTARSRCLQFSASSYIDLHSFLSEFNKFLNYAYMKKSYKSPDERADYEKLSKATQATLYMVNESVLANAAGSYLAQAKGISIYFPIRAIDQSYAKTAFAKDSKWFELLKSVLYGE